MYVIRLPNGNLLVPESVASDGGGLMADAYVEIGPDDAEYERLAEQALTEPEFDEPRRRWREGEETARRQFPSLPARHGKPARAQGSEGNPRPPAATRPPPLG